MTKLTKVDHPAKFTDSIVDQGINTLLSWAEETDVEPGELAGLDPFAGTGKGVDALWKAGFMAGGVELEPEWARQCHHDLATGSCLNLEAIRIARWHATRRPRDEHPLFDFIFTSPCYGNRMADHHDAKDDSRRNTYRHRLGREPNEGSAAVLQWGPAYQAFHLRAWSMMSYVVRPEGLFVLNISDHIRRGKIQPVTAWHIATLANLGWELQWVMQVKTPRQRHGANGHLRVGHESLVVLRRTDEAIDPIP